MSRRVRLMAVVAMATSAAALADESRQFGAVICISEAGAPWREKARGTLTRTRSKDVVSYELEAGGHTLTWRFVSAPPKGTTVTSPGYLMDRFAAQPVEVEERRQSVYADGEIREEAPSSALRLVVGSSCPRAKKPAEPSRLRG